MKTFTGSARLGEAAEVIQQSKFNDQQFF